MRLSRTARVLRLLLALLVMPSGIGFVALVTGSIAERFLTATPRPSDTAEILRKLDEISARLDRLEEQR
jgi:hypothetical protein